MTATNNLRNAEETVIVLQKAIQFALKAHGLIDEVLFDASRRDGAMDWLDQIEWTEEGDFSWSSPSGYFWGDTMFDAPDTFFSSGRGLNAK